MLGNRFNLSICILIGCEILAFQANSRALSSVYKARDLYIRRQTVSVKNGPLWESSWHSETVDGVTTITTATFGHMPVGESISQASSALWSYTYSYPDAPNLTQNVDVNGPHGSTKVTQVPQKSKDTVSQGKYSKFNPAPPNDFSASSSPPNDDERSSTPSRYGSSSTSSGDDPSRASSGNPSSNTPSGYGPSSATSGNDDPSIATSGNSPTSAPSGNAPSDSSVSSENNDPSIAPSGNGPSRSTSLSGSPSQGTTTTTTTTDGSSASPSNSDTAGSTRSSQPTTDDSSGPPSSSDTTGSTTSSQPIRTAKDATKFTTEQATGDIKEWLENHNLYRSRYGAPDLKWDSSLADQAQGVANSCRWRHTPSNPSGENIAAGQESAEDTVIAWVEGPQEKDSYDPASPQFSHFTQVVWEATTHVGCATVSCTNIEGASLPQSPVPFYVCEYAPKGNIYGMFRDNVKSAKGGQPLGSNTVYPNRSKSLGTSYYFPAPEA